MIRFFALNVLPKCWKSLWVQQGGFRQYPNLNPARVRKNLAISSTYNAVEADRRNAVETAFSTTIMYALNPLISRGLRRLYLQRHYKIPNKSCCLYNRDCMYSR